MLNKIHPDTYNRAEGVVHPPKQERETEAMALTSDIFSCGKVQEAARYSQFSIQGEIFFCDDFTGKESLFWEGVTEVSSAVDQYWWEYLHLSLFLF